MALKDVQGDQQRASAGKESAYGNDLPLILGGIKRFERRNSELHRFFGR